MAIYLGLDPGVSGGIAAILTNEPLLFEGRPSSIRVRLQAFEALTLEDQWHWISSIAKELPGNVIATVEQQTARPTIWVDKVSRQQVASALRSTCILYGYYQRLEALLTAAGISHDSVHPRVWQSALAIPPRRKSETSSKWKQRLKAKAQALYPNLGITLATSDALLIAHFTKLRAEGLV